MYMNSLGYRTLNKYVIIIILVLSDKLHHTDDWRHNSDWRHSDDWRHNSDWRHSSSDWHKNGVNKIIRNKDIEVFKRKLGKADLFI